MNRRDFVRSLGLGAVAAVVPAPEAKPEPAKKYLNCELTWPSKVRATRNWYSCMFSCTPDHLVLDVEKNEWVPISEHPDYERYLNSGWELRINGELQDA